MKVGIDEALVAMGTRKSRSLTIVQQAAAQLYCRFVEGIKERIRTAQLKAALAANAELVLHYWEIGREILGNQKREGWGAKVIDRTYTYFKCRAVFKPAAR